MKRQFQTFNFHIQNASADSVDIYIDGQIVDAETEQILRDWFGDDTSTSFKSFRSQLNAVEAKTYNVYINSPGGLVTDAMAIHDLLVEMQGKGKTVNTVGRGIVASAATYILMSGNNSRMSKNSWFMIHNVSGFAYGDVNEVERQAATLRKFNDATRDFYADATGIRKEDITKMMNAETWLTADEAKEKGFITEVDGEATFTNALRKEDWQFQNMAVFNAYNANVKKPAQADPNLSFQNELDDMKKFFLNLGADIKKAINSIKAPENNDHETLMNSIGDAVSNCFTSAGDALDEAVQQAIKEGVQNAVTEAVKPFEDRIATLETANTALETKNGDLEAEITNLKGKPTNTGTSDGPAPIGNFKK